MQGLHFVVYFSFAFWVLPFFVATLVVLISNIVAFARKKNQMSWARKGIKVSLASLIIGGILPMIVCFQDYVSSAEFSFYAMILPNLVLSMVCLFLSIGHLTFQRKQAAISV